MFLRVFSFVVLIILSTSCDQLSFVKKNQLPELDTIVDFTSVDVSPSFKECDSLIAKEKKSACFRTTIHQKIGAALQKHTLSIKDSIDETVLVDLLISAQGNLIFKAMQSSEKIKTQLPELDSIVQLAVKNLPKVYPAIKRGIPVTSKYQLPIRILLKE